MSAEFEKLKALVQSGEYFLQKLAGLNERGEFAEALAVIGRENGIQISAEEIERQLIATEAGGSKDGVDDAALEAVCGGESRDQNRRVEIIII
ncbi:MAG: Nif11-like leader peptide family natural product precursor [Alphaproteobacteria bacterium]|nr:Nif11-like leader peptide family natural product precursor [Alphaproteobacteria bacterium]MBU0797216.1 Nif11-like leader peptide family natural product precursor [Alphaproteobacteria bacterium]MBU0888996.1 Nif11-like leader peptide family natural product precursor [Alphaproteobacteria bacterium]MBU1814016.1 Nif11-like leader peptide family natural product precursor [Alphaproteobacteria bacterium]MBU2092111.1 Nif11-like leader peptide family natural product precursor [Alphaproteobacteria bact